MSNAFQVDELAGLIQGVPHQVIRDLPPSLIRRGTVTAVDYINWVLSAKLHGSPDTTTSIPFLPTCNPIIGSDIWLFKIGDTLLAFAGRTSEWATTSCGVGATTTNPILGTGNTDIFQYMIFGKLCIFKYQVTFGTSAMSAGSGNFYLDPVGLPAFDPSVPNRCGGEAQAFHASNSNFATPFMFIDGSGNIQWRYPATWPAGASTAVTNVSPWAWSFSDQLSGSGFATFQ